MLVKNDTTQGLQFEQVKVNTSYPMTKATIAHINAACDRVEDAGSSTALLIDICDEYPPMGEDSADKGDCVYLVNKWEQVIRRIERLRTTIICAAAGHVNGLGLGLLLSADHRIVCEGCEFSVVSDNGDIMPTTSLQRLAHQVGTGYTRRMALMGAHLDSRQAYEQGIVDEITTAPVERACQYIANLCTSKNKDIAVRRSLLLEAFSTSYEQGLGSYLAACDRIIRSRDVSAEQQ